MELRIKTREQTVNRAPGKKGRQTRKPPALRLATWNIRTMCPGLSDDLQQIDDARKTAVISGELNILVLSTHSYHSADCNTDHSMVASRVRLQPKRIH